MTLALLTSVSCLPNGTDCRQHPLAIQSGAHSTGKIDDPEEEQASSRSDQQILIGTDLVSLTVTVTDSRGRFVSGMSKERFLVYDNGVQQKIDHFSDADAPASLGIVFDVSRSMKDKMRGSLKALKRFIETSHVDDDIFLITFNDKAKLAQDFTTSGDEIIEQLRLAAPSGSTALYDAAYLAVEKVQHGRHPKKAILIISDGEDNHSRYNSRDLRARVREADVQIYAIGLTDATSGDYTSSKYGRSVLEAITELTGGCAFFPGAYHDELIIEICARIALELRHQYSMAFYPSEARLDGRWHRIQVKLKPPNGLGRLSLTYREGYQSLKR